MLVTIKKSTNAQQPRLFAAAKNTVLLPVTS